MAANKLKSFLIGLLPLVPLADVKRVTQREYHWVSDSAQVAAGTDLVERCVFIAERPCEVTVATIVCFGAIAADANDRQIFTAAKRTVADPATNVDFLVADTIATDMGALAAFTPINISSRFNATASKRIFAAGDALWVKTTHAGAGKNMPVTTMTFQVEELSD